MAVWLLHSYRGLLHDDRYESFFQNKQDSLFGGCISRGAHFFIADRLLKKLFSIAYDNEVDVDYVLERFTMPCYVKASVDSEKQSLGPYLKTVLEDSDGDGEIEKKEKEKLRSCVNAFMKFHHQKRNGLKNIYTSNKLTDLRKHMSPIMFEALIFLKINRKLWDVARVATAMKNNEPQGMERDLDFFMHKSVC